LDFPVAARKGVAFSRGLIVSLDASGCGIGDVRAALLASSPVLATAKVLNLRNNKFGTAAARAIAASQHLRNLSRLDLSGNRIGTAGAMALAASQNLERLSHLDLSGNRIGPSGLRALRDAFGGRVYLIGQAAR